MRTVHPSTMIGAYSFEQDRVPRDEFQIRLNTLNEIMDRKGFKAMLVYGDAREHSDLAYLTNFIPRHRWALALLPRQGEPRLLVSMSSRDMPAQRLMTWIPEVLSAWNWETAFDPWLAGLKIDDGADIGAVRFDLMRPALFQSIEKSLGNRFRLVEADAGAGARRTRPRELSLIREACAVARSAAAYFLQAWHDGGGTETAALAGERRARALAAQDARTLVSFDEGRTLAPFCGAFAPKSTARRLLGYVAVKHRGYWAESFVAAVERPGALEERIEEGLNAVLRLAAPGVSGAALFAAASQPLGGLALHPALSGSVGRRIGLSANEGSELKRDAGHVLATGDVYGLHVGASDAETGAIASAMVAITDKGCELLLRSPEVLVRR
ncbi:MAG TPA: M24 family metallopeptidase [Xanthobacteraceae bacterium]|jgi:Xaa-Pro aminopeptidase|nr:M24 family metallopeptidase [Xanthobacteraceae bacterium]